MGTTANKRNKLVWPSRVEVERYSKEVRLIVAACGYPNQLVSDLSTVADFFPGWTFRKRSEDHADIIAVRLSSLSRTLAMEIKGDEKIWELAKHIKERSERSERSDEGPIPTIS
jgi:hypothetical protein